MRAKSILTLLLGLFAAVAVILVARQAVRGAAPEVPAAVQSAAVLPVPVEAKAPEAAAPAPAVIEPVAATEDAAVPAPAAPVAAPKPRAEKPTVAEKPKEAVPAAVTPQHKVVAMYFHGDVRCVTCRKVEAYAREAVEEGFREQVAAGLVEFRPVNVDREENKHFIQDYQLMNKSVVVVDEAGGSVTRWVKLDNVWGLVGNREAYFLYVQDAVRAYVEN